MDNDEAFLKKRLAFSNCLTDIHTKIRSHYNVTNTNDPLFSSEERKDRKDRNGYFIVAGKPFFRMKSTVLPALREEMDGLSNIWEKHTQDVLVSHSQVKFIELLAGSIAYPPNQHDKSDFKPFHGLNPSTDLYYLVLLLQTLLIPLFPRHRHFQVLLMKTQPGITYKKWKQDNIMHADFTEDALKGCCDGDLPKFIILPLEENYSLEIGNYLGPMGKAKKPTTEKIGSVHLGGFLVCDARQYHTTAVYKWQSGRTNKSAKRKSTTTQETRLHFTLATDVKHITHTEQAINLNHYEGSQSKDVQNVLKTMFDDKIHSDS